MSFSRQIFAVVAAALLATHVVVGCCAHHEECGEADSAIAHAGHECSHHAGETPAPPDEEAPCDGSCDEGSCSFVAGSKIAIPEFSQLAGVISAISELRLAQSSSEVFCADRSSDRAISPHVPLYLSKCVLVV